jgi:hypothetical protein
MYRLYFEDHEPPIECESLEALGQAIDSLHERFLRMRPICAALNLGRYEVDFGLGADEGFIYIQVEPFDGEYYLSVGDLDARGWIDFFGCGGHTPFERAACVPYPRVRKAVLDFAAEQRLPEDIQWQDWDGRVVRDDMTAR